MRLARFTHNHWTRLGVVADGEIIDAADDPTVPLSLQTVLEAGECGRQAMHRLAGRPGVRRFPLSDVRLEAPLPHPPKFLAIGLNFADHIEETGAKRRDFPIFFNKQSTCVTGPFDPIHRPRVSEKLDYEGELGMVIGRRCRHVPAGRAHEVVAGYLVTNDVSVRDWQRRAPSWTLGKSFDTHGPIGPWLVTADEVPDPHDLAFTTHVNGALRQRCNTRHMIWSCWEQIAVLSTVFTLEPGDIIATGTCSGVGFRMDPPAYLQAGDVVRVEIEGIGAIENPVIEEPASTVFIDDTGA